MQPIRTRRIVRNVPTFTKIIAATDFSEDSTNAFAFAEELARKFSAEIIVVHVDQPLAPVMVSELSPGLDAGTMNRIAEEQRLLAVRELDQITGRLRENGLKARSLFASARHFLRLSTPRSTKAPTLSCWERTGAPDWLTPTRSPTLKRGALVQTKAPLGRMAGERAEY